MKRLMTNLWLRLLLLGPLAVLPALAQGAPADKLVLTFFGSRTCAECLEIKETLLKPFEADYAPLLVIRYRDIEQPDDFRRLAAMEKAYAVSNSCAQELYFPDRVLCGYDAIVKDGRKLIEFYLTHPETWTLRREIPAGTGAEGVPATAEAIRERVSRFTLFGLFAAGFLDGVNPCAIATMIFLISFIGTQHRRRREVLAIGLTFTGTVFVTYLSIGLGAFKILTMMSQYYWLSLAIRGTAVTLAVVVALMSIWDAIKYYRTRDLSQMKVQLPRGIKMLIHGVIRGGISRRQFMLGAVAAGFVVTLLEGACTAKIYLPTIVLMTRQFGFRLLGWALLIGYNLLFVLPLLCVMIASAYGLQWTRLSRFTQNHLALMKVLLALVLFALAAFISVGK